MTPPNDRMDRIERALEPYADVIRRHDEAMGRIDVRLERLTERQESLAQAVELMHRDNEARFAQIRETFQLALDSLKRLENSAR
jgi:archaellum component FlaC